MRGLRIPGLTSATLSPRRFLQGAFAAALAVSLAACLPEDRKAAEQGRETLVRFQTTSEQVQRRLKTARLPAQPPAIAALPPAAVEMRPAASAAAPATEAEAPAPRLEMRPGPSLARFHRALYELETGQRKEPVTVLHLGDSHIASDRFTGDLRKMFQDRFGDAGRGLMMPGFPFTYYRARGVRFAKRGAWAAANSFKRAGGLYGVTGVRLTTRQKNARLSLTSEKGPFEWAEITFLTGPGHGTAVVAVDGNGKAAETRAAAPGVRRVRIDHKGLELSIRATGDGAVTVLSWAVGHNRPGIRYVNLGIPGATADTPRLWDADIVKSDIANLDPDLIVLGFGTNEGFNDGLKIDAYEERVRGLTGQLLAAAPKASLAIIGPADGARLPRFARSRDAAPCRPLDDGERRNYRNLLRAGNQKLARWHAPPKLAAVRGALQRVARVRKAHFWDWSQSMGGPCGVHKWSRSKPRLAASDHVHITREGSRLSARDFFASLMAGYQSSAKLASRSDFGNAPESVSR